MLKNYELQRCFVFQGKGKKRVHVYVTGFSQMYLKKRIRNIDLCVVGRGRFWQAVGKEVQELSHFKGRKG